MTTIPFDLQGPASTICHSGPCAPGGTDLATSSCYAATTAGHSVLLNSGQFTWQLPLLSISSVGGMGWSFGLDYLSDSVVDDVLGLNFNFPQHMMLEEDVDFVDLLMGDNTIERFDEVSPNVYEPADENNTQSTLVRTDAGTSSDEFTLTSSQGVVTKFFGFHVSITTPGRLKSITDRYGSTQTFEWTETSGIVQLTKVTDSYGREIEYRYYGSEYAYRLREIEDFLGRKLNFQYDDHGHLVAVVTPSIHRAADGNTFPGGTAYVLEYDTENVDPQRQDDLIRIYYPNETQPYVDTENRTVDVAQVTANATPRYEITYGQNPGYADTYGRVVRETVGDPNSGIGGYFYYVYTTTGLPSNPFSDATNDMVFRCTVTDRNGNDTVYDFNAQRMPVRVEVERNRDKIDIPSTTTFPSYITWTQYNDNNQPLQIVYPEGNTDVFEYEDGQVTGIGDYPKRKGLLLRRTRLPGNSISVTPTRSGSSGQTELTRRYFYDPIFNQQTAMIEERGNPIASGPTYFTPQNGGTTPTNSDRSRYATITYFDYQKNQASTVQNDSDLQALLGLSAADIGDLIDYVDDQMKATDGSGGLPNGFEMDLGDINGDGTGDGASSGLAAAAIEGNAVKVLHPEVRLIGATSITQQVREEIFTYNNRGQQSTHTGPEGNLTITIRYPYSDPEGDGRFVSPGLGAKQYGRVREIRVDADPNDVMSLIGSDGDLVDFVPDIISRSNTPGVYQNLVTRYEGTTLGAGAGCASCAYDALGNPLAMTDARGFATHFDRNELGEVYRTISPDPYRYKVETYYDANRNVVRVDTEDQFVLYESLAPTDADYAHFTPEGSGSTAEVPSRVGTGGEIRPGWFTSLTTYDLLDNVIEQDIDASGSAPDRLKTQFEYDANQNLIKMTKPEGNTVEYDYDERNLPIATRAGNSPDTPAVTITAHDANGNVLQVIGPAQRGASGNHQTVVIEDAFDSGSQLSHTGDFVQENEYDGFDRAINSTDAAGNVTSTEGDGGTPRIDPGGRAILATFAGPISGATPTNRTGTNNETLSQSSLRYDEAGRQYESQQDVFVADTTSLSSTRNVTHTGGGLAANSTADDHTGTVTVVSSGSATANESYVLTRTVYDRASRTVETLSDNTGLTSAEYDGANRAIITTDALGNQVEYLYDGNGNVVFERRIERPTITEPAAETEVFEAATRYDSLNRVVERAVANPQGTAS